jgi:uncharacterized membrane protein
MLPSTPLRPRSVAIFGENAYKGILSILLLIAIYWLVREFNIAPYGDKLWLVPDWWRWTQTALILIAFILVFAGGMAPNPSAPGGERALENPNAATGIFAITRHPVMWGVAIWAITHVISQATWRGFAFFGAFAATALIGSWLQQNRKLKTVPGWAGFEAKTSFFPFVAILQGRAKLSLRAIGWRPVVLAVIVWAALLHFHAWLFGFHPLPISA